MIKSYIEDQQLQGNDLLAADSKEDDLFEKQMEEVYGSEEEYLESLRYSRIISCVSDENQVPCYDPNCPICRQIID